jgi:hypothetical protein
MTDARPRNAPPRLNLSGREWKLFLIGGLGVAYAASLSVVATQAQPAASQSANAAPTTTAAGNTVIWLDQLPVDQRPTVALPRGWTIAAAAAQPPVSQGAMASVATSSTTPGAAARVPRIVTRTS